MLSDSTDLFQRLSLDESLRRTAAVYREGFLVFSQIGLLVVAIKAIVWALFLLILMPLFDLDVNQLDDPNYLMQKLGPFYGVLGLNMMVGMVVGAWGNASMIRVVADIYLQKEPSVRDCLQIGARHACTILTASFLAFWGVMIGLLLFLFPGLYLSVTWFLVSPAIVMEGLGVFASFRRSSELVSGSWCYVFCTYMISFIFMLVIQMVWSAVMVGGNDASHTLFSFFGSILAAIPGILFIPIFAIMMSIMYINLRIEKEGLNADRLARNMGESSGDTAAYSALLNDSSNEENNKVDVGFSESA